MNCGHTSREPGGTGGRSVENKQLYFQRVIYLFIELFIYFVLYSAVKIILHLLFTTAFNVDCAMNAYPYEKKKAEF